MPKLIATGLSREEFERGVSESSFKPLEFVNANETLPSTSTATRPLADDDRSAELVYAMYSAAEKTRILAGAGLIAVLTPFTDTIYLPALASVKSSLPSSPAQVAATVSAYMAAVGIGQLVFGPFADRYGRLPVIYPGLVAYFAVTIGCAFASDIDQLIVLRTVEGFLISSSVVAVQAIIADVFPPAERGTAMGAFLGPLLVGPVIAPLLGGALAQRFGWRATFILLAVITVPIVAIFRLCVPRETHHYFVRKGNPRFGAAAAASSGSSAAADSAQGGCTKDTPQHGAAEAPAFGPHPVLQAPWTALEFLFAADLWRYYANLAATFAPMFTSLVVLPIHLALPPYRLSASLIGVAYLPVGFAMMLGSPVGGILSDRSIAHRPGVLASRFYWGLPLMLLVPVGGVGFGYALDRGAHLGLVLFAQCVLGFGQATQMPSTLGYLSSARPQHAGAVGAVALFTCFAASAVAISLSVTISAAAGIGAFFAIASAVSVSASAAAAAYTLRIVAASPRVDVKWRRHCKEMLRD
jgi:multidrug resistance protein